MCVYGRVGGGGGGRIAMDLLIRPMLSQVAIVLSLPSV